MAEWDNGNRGLVPANHVRCVYAAKTGFGTVCLKYGSNAYHSLRSAGEEGRNVCVCLCVCVCVWFV